MWVNGQQMGHVLARAPKVVGSPVASSFWTKSRTSLLRRFEQHCTRAVINQYLCPVTRLIAMEGNAEDD